MQDHPTDDAMPRPLPCVLSTGLASCRVHAQRGLGMIMLHASSPSEPPIAINLAPSAALQLAQWLVVAVGKLAPAEPEAAQGSTPESP